MIESELKEGFLLRARAGQFEIGKYCAVGRDLRVFGNCHDYRKPSISNELGSSYPRGMCSIGNDVWVGDRVTLICPVSVGNGSILGAGAVVTNDVEPYSIVGGVPARKIRNRFSFTVIAFLEELQWWNWDEDKIKQNKEFFDTDISTMSVDQIETLIV